MAGSRSSDSRSACAVLSEGPRFAHWEGWERCFLLGQPPHPPEGAWRLGFSPGSGRVAVGVGGSQDPSVFRSIDTFRSRGGLSPRRWCHLHLIRCSAFASDKQIAEEKESLSPRIPHWADCLYFQRGWETVAEPREGRDDGELTTRCWRWVFPTFISPFSAACEAGVEHNSVFLLSLGNGGTEGISVPLHHPRGPAQPGSKAPETIWREERGV